MLGPHSERNWTEPDHPPPAHPMPAVAEANVPDLDDLAGRINKACHDAELALADGFNRAIRAGELLIEAKLKVEHGNWMMWLKQNTRVSQATANRYMECARNRDEIEANSSKLSNLTIDGALKLIARPKDEAKAVIREKKAAIKEATEGAPKPDTEKLPSGHRLAPSLIVEPTRAKELAAEYVARAKELGADLADILPLPPAAPTWTWESPAVVIDVEDEAPYEPQPEEDAVADVTASEPEAPEPPGDQDDFLSKMFGPLTGEEWLRMSYSNDGGPEFEMLLEHFSVPLRAWEKEAEADQPTTDLPAKPGKSRRPKKDIPDERQEKVLAYLERTGEERPKLADRCGVPRPSFRNWLNGYQPLAEKYHAAIDQALAGEVAE